MHDLIERQAAIDAILAVTGNSSVRELYEHVQEHELSDMWSGGVNAAIDIIIAVPSAQPDLEEAYICGETEAEARFHAERKTGRWINVRHDNIAECDQCGITGRAWMNFCFDCCADMREGAERRTDERTD